MRRQSPFLTIPSAAVVMTLSMGLAAQPTPDQSGPGREAPPPRDPVSLPDTPEAVVEELRDRGVTGVEVPPGIGEPPQVQAAPPQADAAAELPTRNAASAEQARTAVLGRTVRDLDGQVVGQIDDLLIDEDGELTHAVIRSGERMIAVPWAMFRAGKDQSEAFLPQRRDDLIRDPAYGYEVPAEAAVGRPADR